MRIIPSKAARRRLLFSALTLVIVCLGAVSCSSNRGSGSTGGGYSQGSAIALSAAELRTLRSSLEASYGEWDNVKVPMTLRLQSPKRFSIGGTLTMERGESIRMSLRLLGMEMAALMVTRDSVFALYKIDKLYFAESIADMLGGFPATVENLQDLLLGRAFALGSPTLEGTSCRLDGNSAEWTLTPACPFKGYGYSFSVDTPTGAVGKLTVTLPSRSPITASYSDFSQTPAGPVASTALITGAGAKTTLEGEIELNMRRAEWGSAKSARWSVPKGYRRVSAADILGMLSKI